VERQLLCPGAAVLAGVLIPQEDLASSESNTWTRPLDQVVQPDDGRNVEVPGRRAEDEPVHLQDLRLAAVDEDKRSARVAPVQRLVILVENEHLTHVGLLTYHPVRTGQIVASGQFPGPKRTSLTERGQINVIPGHLNRLL